MCHPLPLDQVLVSFELDHETESVRVFCEAAAHAKTGVEMEALAGATRRFSVSGICARAPTQCFE